MLDDQADDRGHCLDGHGCDDQIATATNASGVAASGCDSSGNVGEGQLADDQAGPTLTIEQGAFTPQLRRTQVACRYWLVDALKFAYANLAIRNDPFELVAIAVEVPIRK